MAISFRTVLAFFRADSPFTVNCFDCCLISGVSTFHLLKEQLQTLLICDFSGEPLIWDKQLRHHLADNFSCLKHEEGYNVPATLKSLLFLLSQSTLICYLPVSFC